MGLIVPNNRNDRILLVPSFPMVPILWGVAWLVVENWWNRGTGYCQNLTLTHMKPRRSHVTGVGGKMPYSVPSRFFIDIPDFWPILSLITHPPHSFTFLSHFFLLQHHSVSLPMWLRVWACIVCLCRSGNIVCQCTPILFSLFLHHFSIFFIHFFCALARIRSILSSSRLYGLFSGSLWVLL